MIDLTAPIWIVGSVVTVWAQSRHIAGYLAKEYWDWGSSFRNELLGHIMMWGAIVGSSVVYGTEYLPKSEASVWTSIIVAGLSVYLASLVAFASVRITVHYSFIGGYPDNKDGIERVMR